MKKYVIGPSIKMVNTAIERRINEQNVVYHLTQSQGLVVIYLADQTNYTATQTEIMELLGVAHTTTLNLLKSMERKGMIKIQKNPQDRRSNLVTLIWGDPSIYDQLNKNAEDNETTLLKGFTKTEIQCFKDFLSRAYDNLMEG
jgi:DNA-binding MarR family transcriptional regulator